MLFDFMKLLFYLLVGGGGAGGGGGGGREIYVITSAHLELFSDHSFH